MRLDSTLNAKRNILWGAINKIINILLPFFSRTLVIYELGINYIGLGSLFTSILSTLSLAELGFDIGIVTIMYQGVAQNDKKKLCSLLHFIKRAYLFVGVIILTLGLICLPLIPYLIKDLNAIPDEINIYILFIIFLVNAVISYFFGGYKTCILEAYQRQDIISNINSIAKIVFFLVQVVVLIIFKNYYLYAIVNILSSVFTNVSTYYAATKNYPNIIPKGSVEKKEMEHLKKILSGTFLSKLGTVLSNSFDSIVISSFLGIVILGYYSNYSYIINSIQGFIVVIYVSLQAGFGNSVALDSVDKNYLDLEKYTFVYSWILGWSSICLLYLSSPFIYVWIGERGILPTIIVFLCVICFYISNCSGILGTYKNAIGIWWEDRYRCLVCGIVNLLINIVLVLALERYGEVYSLAGVVVSTIITTGFIGIPWSTKVTFDLYFKDGLKKYIFELLSYFLVTLFNMAICYPVMLLISTEHIGNGVLVLLLRGLTLCVIPNLIYIAFYRKNSQFGFFVNYLKNLIGKQEVK
ncbi:MAG: oligosaccharide flippase family protein [Erysipelotrichaceae bacterium]